MADSFYLPRFQVFADSLKFVESCYLRRKFVIAKLGALRARK